MAKLDDMSNCWAEIVSGIVNRPAKNTVWSVIQRLVLGASVYFIWQERNARNFGDSFRSEDVLFKVIVESVRFRIMGLKLKVTNDVISASKIWNFPTDNSYKHKDMLDELSNDNMVIDGES